MSPHIYHTDDLVFTVPRSFRDRTIHALEWDADGDRIALTLQREPVQGALSLEQIYRAAVAKYPTLWRAFRVDGEETLEIGDQRVMRLRFRWKHDTGAMYHHQAFLLLADISFVFTASGPARAMAAIDALIDSAVTDLRLREA